MQTLAAIFRDGGLFMYFILAALVIGIAIIIERTYMFIHKYRIDARALWEKVSKYIKQGEIEKARILCEDARAPIMKILHTGISSAHETEREIQKAVDEVCMDLIPQVDKRIFYLLTLANCATLFGLLGTIHGLIQAFSAVAHADPSQKASLLAAGISIALYNTAFGIGVAVFFLIMYAVLQSRATRVVDEIDSFSVKVINLLSRRKGGEQA